MSRYYKNKEYRELCEMQNLFKDPMYIRQAWRNVGNAILRNPASLPVITYDSKGAKTMDSMIQEYTYNKLHSDLREIANGDVAREPTELEMILACQAIKARTDTSAAVFMRDTLGAKPVDESKVEQTTSIFEGLTDEELELIAAVRASRAPGATTTIVDGAEAPASTDTSAEADHGQSEAEHADR